MSSDDQTNGVEAGSEATQADAADPLVGAMISNRYSILARVAKGGTAVVYRALDSVLNREVAIKILHEHLENKQEVAERFKKEAVLIAQLRHPNILNVYDFLEYKNRAVLVVEFMPGITLSALVTAVQKIPEDIVLMFTLEILQGLKAAHQKGITHRDIKPANVLVHSDLGIKISDFGLAKILGSDDGITKMGVFVGTPSFSSPEQIEGRPVDHRSDIFSLGLTTYMLATRTHAFKKKGDSTTTVWFKTVRGTFESARERNPELSSEFETILNKALEVNVDKRYQSADAMIRDIEELLRRRGMIPYQEKLKAFMADPEKQLGFFGSHGRKLGISKTLYWALGGLSAAAAAAVFFFYPPNPRVEVPVQEIPSPAAVAPIPPTPEVTPAVEVSPVPPVETPKPSPKAPVKPARAAAPPPVISEAPKGVPIEAKSTLILAGNKFPSFVLHWSGAPNFALSKDSEFSNIIEEGQAKSRSLALKELTMGTYYWKGGAGQGQTDIESLDVYRQGLRALKRAQVVSSQFGDVDLEINPWSQDLKLNWQSGPDAASYRLEIATNPTFSDLLFSSINVTKTATIERFWDKSQILYWRVSYLDPNQNVFLIDPVRKINLTVKGSSPYFDILSPQAGESIEQMTIEVRAIGPGEVWNCAAVEEGRAVRSWEGLKKLNNLFVGRVSANRNTKWLVCEAKTEARALYFSIPIRAK